jgi:hypothetical protein
MQEALREIPLYSETIEWIHHSKIEDPSRSSVGNYWHDKHQDQLEGAQGAALTDAVIFFMRVAAAAGLGKFTRGSKTRPDSYLKPDAPSIEAFVSSSVKFDDEATEDNSAQDSENAPKTSFGQTTKHAQSQPQVSIDTSPAIHVNLEIHIAADATAETIAEIFKNMRKYVLSDPANES